MITRDFFHQMFSSWSKLETLTTSYKGSNTHVNIFLEELHKLSIKGSLKSLILTNIQINFDSKAKILFENILRNMSKHNQLDTDQCFTFK